MKNITIVLHYINYIIVSPASSFTRKGRVWSTDYTRLGMADSAIAVVVQLIVLITVSENYVSHTCCAHVESPLSLECYADVHAQLCLM